MSVSAVQFYVQSLLNGKVITGADDLGPIEAWIVPPAVTQLMPSPQVFIWASDSSETRFTIPRNGGGMKRVVYPLTLWIQLATANDDMNDDFSLVLQVIRHILASVPIPVPLTDGQSGETSVLQSIGENIRVKHPGPVSSADQRLLLHNATLTVDVTEVVVG